MKAEDRLGDLVHHSTPGNREAIIDIAREAIAWVRSLRDVATHDDCDHCHGGCVLDRADEWLDGGDK